MPENIAPKSAEIESKAVIRIKTAEEVRRRSRMRVGRTAAPEKVEQKLIKVGGKLARCGAMVSGDEWLAPASKHVLRRP